MKKKCILLAVLLPILFFVYMPVSLCHAEEVEDIYIVSRKCPRAYYEYVTANINNFLSAIDPREYDLGDDVIIGRPFSFCNDEADIFYFPIFSGGEMKYTFRVFPNGFGAYEGILGKAFVNEINLYAKETDKCKPMIFMMEKNSVIVYTAEARREIIKYPDVIGNYNSYPSANQIIDEAKKGIVYETVNICDANKKCEFIRETQNDDPLMNRSSYKFLGNTSSITEHQTNEPWCAAFSTAWIVRYCFAAGGDTTTAYNVMCSQYTNPGITDTIGVAEVIEYAHLRGLWPTYYTGTLSSTSLKNQLESNKPVYLRMQQTISGGSSEYHAIVLRGYYDYGTLTWSVWNPWYTYYDTFYAGGSYVPATSSTTIFNYYQTIYNW